MLSKKCSLIVASALALFLSACGKSELAKEIPLPNNVDSCFLVGDDGVIQFGCADLNTGRRPSYFKSLEDALKEGMACMSFEHKQAMEEYDEKVARQLRYYKKELSKCQK